MTLHPLPFLPAVAHQFIEVVAWVVAIMTLVWRPRSSLFAAVVVLALVGRGATDMPLGALALALAAYALVAVEPVLAKPPALAAAGDAEVT